MVLIWAPEGAQAKHQEGLGLDSSDADVWLTFRSMALLSDSIGDRAGAKSLVEPYPRRGNNALHLAGRPASHVSSGFVAVTECYSHWIGRYNDVSGGREMMCNSNWGRNSHLNWEV